MDTIQGLKSIFATKEDYIEHMETLWVLRELSSKAIEYQNEHGETVLTHKVHITGFKS